MFLLRAKRNISGFTMVLRRVQRKAVVLHWFWLGPKEKTLLFLFVLVMVKRKHRFYICFAWAKWKSMVLHCFCLVWNENSYGFKIVLLRGKYSQRMFPKAGDSQDQLDVKLFLLTYLTSCMLKVTLPTFPQLWDLK